MMQSVSLIPLSNFVNSNKILKILVAYNNNTKLVTSFSLEKQSSTFVMSNFVNQSTAASTSTMSQQVKSNVFGQKASSEPTVAEVYPKLTHCIILSNNQVSSTTNVSNSSNRNIFTTSAIQLPLQGTVPLLVSNSTSVTMPSSANQVSLPFTSPGMYMQNATNATLVRIENLPKRTYQQMQNGDLESSFTDLANNWLNVNYGNKGEPIYRLEASVEILKNSLLDVILEWSEVDQGRVDNEPSDCFEMDTKDYLTVAPLLSDESMTFDETDQVNHQKSQTSKTSPMVEDQSVIRPISTTPPFFKQIPIIKPKVADVQPRVTILKQGSLADRATVVINGPSERLVENHRSTIITASDSYVAEEDEPPTLSEEDQQSYHDAKVVNHSTTSIEHVEPDFIWDNGHGHKFKLAGWPEFKFDGKTYNSEAEFDTAIRFYFEDCRLNQQTGQRSCANSTMLPGHEQCRLLFKSIVQFRDHVFQVNPLHFKCGNRPICRYNKRSMTQIQYKKHLYRCMIKYWPKSFVNDHSEK